MNEIYKPKKLDKPKEVEKTKDEELTYHPRLGWIKISEVKK